MHTDLPVADAQTPSAARPNRARRRAGAAVAAAVLVGAALAGCGSDSSDASTKDTTASSTTSTTVAVTDTIEADLTSAETVLHEVGPDGSAVYGWNRLVGEGTASGSVHTGAVSVEMLGNVDYVDGSGEFFGFITFDFGGGNTVAVRMDGEATAATDTSDAAFSAQLTVIGGTGDLVDATGTGTFEGSRAARVGGTVSGTYTLSITS